MSKIKFTKNELKKQRDSLKQFRHYLPTLQLKKQQLQMKILETRRELEERAGVLQERGDAIKAWVGLLANAGIELNRWIEPDQIRVDVSNISGANIPVLSDVHFSREEYDFYVTPFWVDKAVEDLRLFVMAIIEVEVIKKQLAVLEHELRITTQRVNLFEKIKIPECLDNIRKIRIYLGDQQANAVGISKVAKKKIEQKNLQEALA